MHDERDIIKNLPGTMLLHILSFLPAKDVLKTSILSWHKALVAGWPSQPLNVVVSFLRK
jgi:hypothetical protein